MVLLQAAKIVSLDLSAALLVLNTLLVGVVGWFLRDFIGQVNGHKQEIQELKIWKASAQQSLAHIDKQLETQAKSIETIKDSSHATEKLVTEIYTIIKKQ